jgi:hypothetical protein
MCASTTKLRTTKLCLKAGPTNLDFMTDSPPAEKAAASGSLIPCGIAVDADIETGQASMCQNRVTHVASFMPGKWLRVCAAHANRLKSAGIKIEALSEVNLQMKRLLDEKVGRGEVTDEQMQNAIDSWNASCRESRENTQVEQRP